MPDKINVRPGAIQPRPVRPLTAEEAARLRVPATAAQLDGLVSSAQARRLDGKRLPAAGGVRTPRLPATNNGWTR